MLRVGVQFDSRKASSAVMHFPSSKRDAAEKLYISAEHEKSGYGRDSPGLKILSTLSSATPCIHFFGSVSSRKPISTIYQSLELYGG